LRLPLLSVISITCLALNHPAAAADLPSIDDPFRTSIHAGGDYGVVIGIEHYPFLPGMDINYAHRDAEAFQTLLLYTLGLSPDRIHMLRGGNRAQMEAALQDAGHLAGPGDTVWVYFSGHGAASAADDERLLLGDAVRQDPTAFETEGLRLDQAQGLATAGGADVVLVVDACYTGVGRSGKALAPGAKYVPHAAVTALPRVLIWSAASASEVAGPFDEVEHSAFTYFAVGALRGWADGELDGIRDGRVSAHEANQYTLRALRSMGLRSQTPSLVGARDEPLILSSALEQGPDFRKTTEAPATVPVPVPRASSTARVTTGSDVDLTELARQADLLRREREEREAREREIQQQLEAERDRRRRASESELKSAARAEWKALASLRDAGGPEAEQLVELYLGKYDGASVSVDGRRYPVEIAYVSDARSWIERAQARSSAAGGYPGPAGPVIGAYDYRLMAVDPGEFWMGGGEAEDDANLRRVTLTRGFAIGATEVTQDIFQAVMGTNPSRALGDRHPVDKVTWMDAVRFCNALSEREGLTPAYRIGSAEVEWDRAADGYRLPTEAEWEFAARGEEHHLYAGAGEADDVAWYEGNSDATSHTVAGKIPNHYGLHDMSGNVWEWVWDRHGPSDAEHAVDPEGAKSGSYRVYRGGSWSAGHAQARVHSRLWYLPSYQYPDLGFRVVRTLP
jgi:formylglycine-generating enzyme